ncbi:MAG: nucleotidyltransferase family protein [Ketobacteraceae bacterium]|nr:nucleotidyltransferase family protein [Ketobacteraceae bacterium]
MSSVGFLVLAAGASSRFAGDKLSAVLPTGKSVLETTVAQLPAGYPRHLVCRSGHGSLSPLLEQYGISYSENPDAVSGMASSIRHGVQQTPDWEGWVICLADMPWIHTTTYRTIAAALKTDNIVVPVTDCQGTRRRGNPAAFGRNWYEALGELRGDRGARAIVAANPGRVREVNVKDPGILLDIDYPDDINNLPDQ